MFLFLASIVKPEAVNDNNIKVDSFEREWGMLVNWYFDNHVLR